MQSLSADLGGTPMKSGQNHGPPGKKRHREGKSCPELPFFRTFKAHYLE